MTSVVDGTLSGTITYNSKQITNLHQSKFRGRPEYTSDGRTVMGTIWTLEVEFVVSEDTENECDVEMAALRVALLAPGKKLEYTGKGSGLAAISIDTDLGYGPKPIGFEAVPMGGNQAYLVTWSVEWMSSPCGGQGITEFVWDMQLSSDAQGFVRRTISGRYRLALKGEFRNPDAAFKSLGISVPDGFRRVSTTHQLSPDHLEITFSVVDAEITGPALPPGIVDGEIDYDCGNTGPGFTAYKCSLRGELTVAATAPLNEAAFRFFLIMTHYLQKSRAVISSPAGVDGGKRSRFRPLAMPKKLSWGNSLFARRRTSRFNVEWTVTAMNVTQVFGGFGMYDPIPGNIAHNYTDWSESMQRTWQLGGLRQLEWDGNDVIIGLCDAQATGEIGGIVVGATPISNDNTFQKFGCGAIDEFNSWIAFDNKFFFKTIPNESTHKATQQVSSSSSGETGGPNVPTEFGLFEQAFAAAQLSRGQSQGWDRSDIVQTHGSPDQLVAMVGKAIRIRFQPSIPEMFTFNRIPVVPVSNRQVQTPTLIGSIFGCKIWLVRWAKVYRLDGDEMVSSAGNDIRPPANLVGIGF